MSLHQHKRLVLNLIAAEMLRARSGSSKAAAEQRIADRIRTEFLDDKGFEAEFDASHVTIQDVVNGRIKKITQVKLLLVDGDDKKHFDRFHKQLRTLADKKLCSQCVKESSVPPCRDDAQHDAKLLNKGLCIKAINDCYDFLRAHVQTLLEAWAFREIATSDPLTITLDRCFIGGDPNASPDDNYYRGSVGGATEYKDGPESRCSEVILELNGANFGWEALLSVPWIITHELVCHAFQGRRRGAREGCSKKCPFYEGWMDEVALMLLQEIALRGPPVKCKEKLPSLFTDHGDLVEQEAKSFRKWRYRVGKERRGSPETDWDQGGDAARAVMRFFKARIAASQDHLEALKLLVRLSMFIQRRDPDADEASKIALSLGDLGMNACTKKGTKTVCDGIYQLMFSSMDTSSWIKALEHEVARFTR